MPRLNPTVLQPVTTPGLHFHHVPHLATIKGIIIGMNADTPRPKERAEAKGVEHVGNEGLGMSANGTQSGPGGVITRCVIRAPATAQEGEAFIRIAYTVAAGRLKGRRRLPLLRGGAVVLLPEPQDARDDESDHLPVPGGPASASGGLRVGCGHPLTPLHYRQQGS